MKVERSEKMNFLPHLKGSSEAEKTKKLNENAARKGSFCNSQNYRKEEEERQKTFMISDSWKSHREKERVEIESRVWKIVSLALKLMIKDGVKDGVMMMQIHCTR